MGSPRRAASLVVHLPVLHQGYLSLFERYAGTVDTLWIFGRVLLEGSRDGREMRALRPSVARRLVTALGLFPRVRILGPDSIRHLRGQHLVFSNDQFSRTFVRQYLRGTRLNWDTAFLRWDTARIFSRPPAGYDRVVTGRFHRRMMARAHQEAAKSSDLWRHVGGVLVRDGKEVLSGYNRHMPSEHSPYAVGDPRNFLTAGKRSDLSSAVHCEQHMVAVAARLGIPLKDASLYVTVFSCPVCAKLIAESGIRNLYFASGHSSLGGDEIMKGAGVRLVLVR